MLTEDESEMDAFNYLKLDEPLDTRPLLNGESLEVSMMSQEGDSTIEMHRLQVPELYFNANDLLTYVDLTVKDSGCEVSPFEQIKLSMTELPDSEGKVSKKAFQPREDYREFLELILIFLGQRPSRGVHFRAPAVSNKTRWMAAAIYCLKMWLFQNQFPCDDPSVEKLTDLCVFIVKVYAKYWFTAPSPTKAPYNDPLFLKNLLAFDSVNSTIRKNTVLKFRRHLWYLSEELVSLAFFDNTLPVSVKTSMAKSVFNNRSANSRNKVKRLKRAEITFEDLKCIKNKDLSSFVTQNSLNFFIILNIPYSIRF
nr:PREDICTED: uncharacterized protein LOC109033171 isoform X2 [Bemisia tabaci]